MTNNPTKPFHGPRFPEGTATRVIDEERGD